MSIKLLIQISFLPLVIMPHSALSLLGKLLLSINLIHSKNLIHSYPTKQVGYSLKNISACLNIVYPMLFELKNPSTVKVTHCGVQEFTADWGKIYMLKWVCDYISFFVQPSLFWLQINQFYLQVGILC